MRTKGIKRGDMSDKADLFDGYWRMLVKSYDHPPEREYRFHPIRRWRFDFAWPDSMIAVEVDGNAWHVKGGGRHGTDKDREKINAAASLGWRVFHFSPKMLNDDPAECVAQVQRAVEDS